MREFRAVGVLVVCGARFRAAHRQRPQHRSFRDARCRAHDIGAPAWLVFVALSPIGIFLLVMRLETSWGDWPGGDGTPI
jgi:hypothetical protein